MTKQSFSTYSTKDMMVAAALIACDIPLIEALAEGTHLVFVLGESERCADLVCKWWSGSLQVSATKYAEAIKRLKGLIRSRGY